jgi:hypothetical protein
MSNWKSVISNQVLVGDHDILYIDRRSLLIVHVLARSTAVRRWSTLTYGRIANDCTRLSKASA